MNVYNTIEFTDRKAFRQWLERNHLTEKECWIRTSRSKVATPGLLSYVDAVEEALCYGWIDSTVKNINGISYQRFSPRKRKSQWTELNKERCRRLIKLGLMTESGKIVLPDLNTKFEILEVVRERLQANPRVWSNFNDLPPLYQRVRLDNIHRPYLKGEMGIFNHRLEKLIEATQQGQMIGDWNDNGRLIDY